MILSIFMPRKPVSELTPSELEERRAYMREAKRKSRNSKPTEKDSRHYSDRAEYLRDYNREYQRKLRADRKVAKSKTTS